jgi:hypothetical protein
MTHSFFDRIFLASLIAIAIQTAFASSGASWEGALTDTAGNAVSFRRRNG